MDFSEEEKQWILSKIPDCFEEAGNRALQEGDIRFGLYTQGWVPPENLEEDFLMELLREESAKGNYFMFWEDIDGVRWFQLYPKDNRPVFLENLSNPTLFRLQSDTDNSGKK